MRSLILEILMDTILVKSFLEVYLLQNGYSIDPRLFPTGSYSRCEMPIQHYASLLQHLSDFTQYVDGNFQHFMRMGQRINLKFENVENSDQISSFYVSNNSSQEWLVKVSEYESGAMFTAGYQRLDLQVLERYMVILF